MFVGISLLKSHTLSNLNRDEAGQPKTVNFGAVQRVRISSQNTKKNIRESKFFLDMLQRSNLADELRSNAVRTRELDSVFSKAPAVALSNLPSEVKLAFCKVLTDVAPFRTKELVVYTPGEIAELCNCVVCRLQDWVDAEGEQAVLTAINDYLSMCAGQETKKKKSKSDGVEDSAFYKMVVEPVKKTDIVRIVGSGMTLDVALFGRMLAADGMRQDGAVRVGHFFTTHQASIDSDFFTAMDDYVSAGSAMMGSADFASGCFYEFVGVCVDDLMKSLQEWNPNRDELVRDVVSALVQSLAFESSRSKQTSMASLPSASAILVEVYDENVGFDHSKAFEKPVVTGLGGYVEPSIEALMAEVQRCHRMTDSLHVKRYWLDEFGHEFKDRIAVNCSSMSDLLSRI